MIILITTPLLSSILSFNKYLAGILEFQLEHGIGDISLYHLDFVDDKDPNIYGKKILYATILAQYVMELTGMMFVLSLDH